MISGYQDGSAWKPNSSGNLTATLLKKSASVRGFFLLHFSNLFQTHTKKLVGLMMSG